ncbi:MAG: secretin N-terminal domain-containing protein, partial [Campylobacterota bacterium]|nr:secretin N-terminal domain-containing protein [Campylobacterota bacterium]
MTFIKSVLLSTVLVATLSAREQVNVNFSDLQIKDFIKLISKVTSKNILINHKINGTVDFVSTSPVYDDELIGILISVLGSKGFTLIKKGSMYEIIRATDAAKHNAPVVKNGKKVSGSLMVTHSIKVKDENVDVVAAKVRYLISKTAKLMTMKETNTILITDYPKNIETIKKVIQDLNSRKKMIVRVIPIKHAEIKKLQTRLVNISKSIFNEKIATQKMQIILDDNINGLILVGQKENVKTIEDLIQKLDKESTVNRGVEIFHLKNSDAKGVLASLNAIISKQKFKDPAMKPNISSSTEINAIIAIGEPNVIKGIKMIIDELDKEKYQVYVKAKIVEISQQKVDELGVKYGFGGGAAKTSADGLYAMSANIGTLGDSALMLGASAKKSFALLGTLNFLETNGASKSVSNPSI